MTNIRNMQAAIDAAREAGQIVEFPRPQMIGEDRDEVADLLARINWFLAPFTAGFLTCCLVVAAGFIWWGL